MEHKQIESVQSNFSLSTLKSNVSKKAVIWAQFREVEAKQQANRFISRLTLTLKRRGFDDGVSYPYLFCFCNVYAQVLKKVIIKDDLCLA